MNLEFSKYVILAKFLKEALGDRYDIVLRSVDDLKQGYQIENRTLIKMDNQNTDKNGDEIGLLMDILNSSELKKKDYLCGFTEPRNIGEGLQNSIFYIRDDAGEVMGFLCISEKKRASVSVKDVFEEIMRPADAMPTNIGMEVEKLMKEQIESVWEKYTSGKKKISKGVKMDMMRELFDLGLFRMKGATEQVSQVTGISLASLYRYLSEIIEE